MDRFMYSNLTGDFAIINSRLAMHQSDSFIKYQHAKHWGQRPSRK